MKRIRVDAERRYEVLIGRDLLGEMAEAVSGEGSAQAIGKLW